MQKHHYKKTSINIENNLYLMMVGEGLDLTAFVNRALALFFEVPENPHDKLVREKSEYSVLRLKEKYMREVSEIIKEHGAQQTVLEAAKEKENELIQFGEYLKRSSAFPVFLKALKSRGEYLDEDVLSLVTLEVNKMNGKTYDNTQLWNRAIDWYSKYGEAPA